MVEVLCVCMHMCALEIDEEDVGSRKYVRGSRSPCQPL